MPKAGYIVHVISDCVTSYDLKKLDEMFAYYDRRKLRAPYACEQQKSGFLCETQCEDGRLLSD